MKKILVINFILFFVALTFGQAVGDFGSSSLSAANWGDLTTWKQWDGSGWNTAATAIPSGTDNVWIIAGDTLNINIPYTACKNLNIAGMLQFSKTIIDSMNVNGNILIQATGGFKVQTNTTGGSGIAHVLYLKGDLTHNGTLLDFRSGTAGSTLSVCNLSLIGTTNSTLTVSTPYSTTNGDFNAVTINKTGGAKVILGSNIAMNGGSSTGPSYCNSILTFISGLIETGNYIWICQTSTELNVTGQSSTSYINGAMGRGMSNSVGSSKNFPVGDANGFRPFNLRSTTSGAQTGHYAIVKCISGNANTGSSVFSSDIDKVSSVRYYQIGFNNLTTGPSSMSFDRFAPSYGLDDGVAAGNQHLRVAFSIDNRAHWTGLGQLTHPDTTNLTVLPKSIYGDSLATPYAVTAGTGSMYIALARVAGTTENTLNNTVDVKDKTTAPVEFSLSQNYPNPFNPSTVINYSIVKRSFVTLKVYDALGKEVTTLVNGERDAGSYIVNFNAKYLSNGVYFYRLTSDNNTSVKKMVLMK